MREVKFMVSGSRGWTDHRRIQLTLTGWAQEMRHNYGPLGFILLHGGAAGADRIADKVAHWMGWGVVCYQPDWERYGKSAGVIRNNLMLDQEPAHVFIFWDGRSRGTKQVMDEAERRGIARTVIRSGDV